MQTLELVVWGIYAGIVLASVYAYYSKHIIGAFVRALILKNAFSTETAEALEKLNVKNAALLRVSLRSGSSLYDTVSVVNKNRYYIPESKAEKVKSKYSGDVALGGVIAVIVIFFFAALLGITLLPDFFEYIGI